MRHAPVIAVIQAIAVSIPKGAIMSNCTGRKSVICTNVSIPKGAIMSAELSARHVELSAVSIPKGAIMSAQSYQCL